MKTLPGCNFTGWCKHQTKNFKCRKYMRKCEFQLRTAEVK